MAIAKGLVDIPFVATHRPVCLSSKKYVLRLHVKRFARYHPVRATS